MFSSFTVSYDLQFFNLLDKTIYIKDWNLSYLENSEIEM